MNTATAERKHKTAVGAVSKKKNKTTPVPKPGMGAISAHEIYPAPVVMQLLGIGVHGLRSMRRGGLSVIYVGRAAFVSGAELLRFIEGQAGAARAGGVPMATAATK